MTKRKSYREDQRCVVVRVDIVVYALVALIIVLALASVVWPGRVELALVGSMGTLVAGVLGGWLTFMRLSRTGDEDDEDPAPPDAS